MKGFIVRIPEKEHADLKLYCFLYEKSMNQVIRSLITKFVNESKPKLQKALKGNEGHDQEK